MDYYGAGYSDYRTGGGTSAYHPSYAAQHPNMGRYGPTPPGYRNGMPRSGAMYEGFDRYGYPNAAHSSYSLSPYGYNHTAEMRPSNYYSNHQHSYDSPAAYRNGMANGHGAAAAAAATSAYAYRDPYATDAAMYRSKSNYMMRDTPYQYAGNREYSYYGYGAQQATSPGGASDSPVPPPMHHHNGYGPEYNQPSAAAYPPETSSFPVPSGHNNATDLPYSREYKQARKGQRDKSLSKLVAMNRRLETQVSMMNEAESMDRPVQGYFDANGYADSTNGYGENYCHGTEHNGNNGSWPAPTETVTTMPLAKGGPQKSTKSNDTDEEATTPSPSKNRNHIKNENQSTEKKTNAAETDSVPTKRRRKLKHANSAVGSREDVQNLMPLPGFQQAFGSTEIGRFSEIFFNAPESPIEPLSIFESELDALSPQPWETGDSLEGPHYNQINGPFTPVYADSYGSTDSPTASSSSYFSDIRSNECIGTNDF